MNAVIKKPGIFTSLQDCGRPGFRSFGVPPGGAMDRTALRLINVLLGNVEYAAALEMHFPAPEIVFEDSVDFAIGGAEFDAELNGRPIDNWRRFSASANDLLRFNGRRLGTRAYLAVAGGFEFDPPLGEQTVRIESGTRLQVAEGSPPIQALIGLGISRNLITRYSRSPIVRVLEGNETRLLTAKNEEMLFRQQFTILSDSNRMGYRLSGEPLHLLVEDELISSGVTCGTIQLLPDGQMIVLMADHQTTGGYPRIAHVISADLPLLGQLGPGDKVSFERVGIETAEATSLQFESDIRMLRAGVAMRLLPRFLC